MTLTKTKINVKGLGKTGRGRMPTKRTINLAAVVDEKINLKLAILGIILIVAAAALLGKYAVADRLVAMSRAAAETSGLQTQLDTAYADLAAYSSLEENYAHYTFAGMTAEELNLTKRADVIDLMQRILWSGESAGAWNIRGNQLTVEVVRDSLQQINELARQMEQDPLVDFCTVTDAAMTETEQRRTVDTPPEDEGDEEGENETTVVVQSVKANVIVYVQNPTEADSQ